MGGTGLVSEATIVIDVKANSAALKTLENALSSLGTALNASAFQSQMQHMETALADTRAEVKKIGAELTKAQREAAEYASKFAASQNEVKRVSAQAAAAIKKSTSIAEAANKKLENSAKTVGARLANAYKKGTKDSAALGAQAKETAASITIQSVAEGRAAIAAGLLALKTKTLAPAIAAHSRETRDAIMATNEYKRSMVLLAREQSKLQASRNRTNAQDAGMKTMLAALTQLRAMHVAYGGAVVKSTAADEAAERVKKRLAAAAKKHADAMSAEASRQAQMNVMQNQGTGFMRRNQSLYLSLANATKITANELENYIKLVNAAIQAEKRRSGMLRGQATDVAGNKTKGMRGFIDNVGFNLSAVEQMVDPLYRASFRLQMVGNNMRQWSRDIFMWGRNIMDTFGEFEFMMNRAAGALSIWGKATTFAGIGTDVLQAKLLDLAGRMGIFEAREVAESLYFWASATGQVVKTNEDLAVSLRAIEPIMKVAMMTNTGYEETIKGVYSILTQFYQGDLSKAGTVAEQLFLTTQRTAAEFQDLIMSFKMLGPVAAQAGASFPELNETLGKLSDLGIRGTMAGRALRQMFIQMVRPSGPAKAAMDKLWATPENVEAFGGKSFFEVTFPDGEFVGVTKHFENLAKATEHSEKAQRLLFLAQISTANMLPVMSALMERARREQLGLAVSGDKWSDSQKEAAENFKKNWDIVGSSWKVTFGMLQRGIEAIKITLGSVIAEALGPAIAKFNELTARIRTFIELHPGMAEFISQIVGGVAALSGIAGVLTVAAGSIIGVATAAGFLVVAFNKWIPAIAGVTGIIGAFAAAVIDNMDYIMNAVDEIAGNFNASMESMGMTTGELGDMFASVTAPIRDFAGLVVRLTADAAKFISVLLAWVAGFDKLLGGGAVITFLQALVTLLGVRLLASFVMATGAGVRAALSFIGVGKAASIAGKQTAMFSNILTNVAKAGGARTMAGIRVGLLGIGSAVSGMMGGPIGILFAGLMLAPLISEVPILGDLVDSLADSFQNLSAKTKESLGRFGDFSLKIDAATNDILGRMYPEIEGKNLLVQQIKELYAEGSVASNEEYAAWKAKAKKMMTDLGGEEFITPRQDNKPSVLNSIGAWQADVEKSMSFIDETKQLWHQKWEDMYNVFSQGQVKSESAMAIGLGEFSAAAAKLTQLADFKTTHQNAGIRAGNLLNDIMYQMPDRVTIEEARVWWETFVEKSKGSFSGLDFSEFMTVMTGMIEVGSASDKLTQELLAKLEPGMAMTDSNAITNLLLTPLYHNLNAMELSQDPRWDGLVKMVQSLQEHRDSIITTTLEEGVQSTESITTSINNATSMLTEQVVKSLVPDFEAYSWMIEEMVASNTQNGYEAAADALLSSLPDGRSYIQAAVEGDLGEGGAALVTLAKALLETAGVSSPELAAIVAEDAEEAGAELGRRAVLGWVEGLAEAASRSFSRKDLREAMKKGTGMDQIARILKEETSKLWDKAARGNAGGRNLIRTATQGDLGAISMLVDDKFLRGKEIGGAFMKKLLKMVKTELPDMPPTVRAAWLGWIGKQRDKGRLGDFIDSMFPSIRKIRIEAAKRAALLRDLVGRSLPPQPVVPPSSGNDGRSLPPQPVVTPKTDEAGKAGVTLAASMQTGFQTAIEGMKWTGVVSSVASGITASEEESSMVKNTGGVLGGKVAVGLSDALRLAPAGAGVMTFLDTTRNGAKSKAGDVGGLTGGDLVIGMQNAIRGSSASGAVMSMMNATAGASVVGVMESGRNVGGAWANGFALGVSEHKKVITASFSVATDGGKGESPPKKGPLRKIDKWGYNIGSAWSKSFASGISDRAAFREASVGAHKFLSLKQSMSSDKTEMGFTTTNKKTLDIRLQVSSPDGTVNRQKQADARQGVMEALTLAGLEHMVTVG